MPEHLFPGSCHECDGHRLHKQCGQVEMWTRLNEGFTKLMTNHRHFEILFILIHRFVANCLFADTSAGKKKSLFWIKLCQHLFLFDPNKFREACGLPCHCSQKCEVRCGHSECQLICAESCAPCQEPCLRRCPHYQCNLICSDPCQTPPCTVPCKLRLPCGHECVGLCGRIL